MLPKQRLYSQEEIQAAFKAWQDTFHLVQGVEKSEDLHLEVLNPRNAAWHAYTDARDGLEPGSSHNIWRHRTEGTH